ncbi:hypothetical protein R3P38DRAFT_3532617 [Favolaschia claudopus]|uniref:Uncharacterized protein n=1 Tax=Favolaschia claudopus TaxID=2862362 RepID=A0AAW0BEF6_9AGAR
MPVPIQPRAVTSDQCNGFLVAAITGIDAARISLGSINAGRDIGNGRKFLEAQLSLLDANNATTQIADSLLNNAPPAPADTNARIVSGLKAALSTLSKVALLIDNSTIAAVAAANASMTKALDGAQQAVAANCQTTVS